VHRLLHAAAILSLAVGPLLATGASPSPSPSPSPSLSPSLSQVLIAPPSGFGRISDPPFNGRFNAKAYTDSYGTKAAEADRVLTSDGFVDGYGLAWLQPSAGHALIEFVIAFQGGSGAKKWLLYEEAADHNNAGYLHSDTISGIDPYYGVHLKSGSSILDGFSFVKGNDMIGVGFISARDDVLSLATAQTKKQYAAAPAETIPPAQWPENAPTAPGAASSALGGLAAKALGVALVLAIIGVVLGLIVRSRRRVVAPAAPAASTVAAAVTPAAPAGAPLELSPDGTYWWNGLEWKDTELEAPPNAQRSDDGSYWWDGTKWRTVPHPAPVS
jgi:pyruvate/2-oxoglutarate dehydrogenase complex dihydrolipoamide acyltransferase (E2) component